jgi:hypothetical protein
VGLDALRVVNVSLQFAAFVRKYARPHVQFAQKFAVIQTGSCSRGHSYSKKVRLTLGIIRPSLIFLTFTILLNAIPAPISLAIALVYISKTCSSLVVLFLIISAATNMFMIAFASYLHWQFAKPYESVSVLMYFEEYVQHILASTVQKPKEICTQGDNPAARAGKIFCYDPMVFIFFFGE